MKTLLGSNLHTLTSLPCTHSKLPHRKLPGLGRSGNLLPCVTPCAVDRAGYLTLDNAGAAIAGTLLLPLPAFAESGVYDPAAGDQFLTNLTGVLYVALVAYFLYRVLGRRAKQFREEKISKPVVTKPPQDDKVVSGWDTIQGAAIAGCIALVLWFLAYNVDIRLTQFDLPEQYTARNIAVTLRTVVIGLLYLSSFVFGANCLGLLGFTFELLLDPSKGLPEEYEEGPQLPARPKISVTMSPAEVRRAFDKVSKTDDEQEEDD